MHSFFVELQSYCFDDYYYISNSTFVFLIWANLSELIQLKPNTFLKPFFKQFEAGIEILNWRRVQMVMTATYVIVLVFREVY